MLDALLEKRRSIRKYKGDPPSSSTIQALIQSAMNTPSPSNTQPVSFIQINGSAIQKKLLKEMAAGQKELIQRAASKAISKRINNRINLYFRYSTFMFDAPTLFAVGTSKHTSGFSTRLFDAGLLPDNRSFEKDMSMTAGLAVHAFMLKASELNLGTCILTAPLIFIKEPEKILEIDDHLKVQCFLTLGIPDETPEPISRKLTKEALILR